MLYTRYRSGRGVSMIAGACSSLPIWRRCVGYGGHQRLEAQGRSREGGTGTGFVRCSRSLL